MGSLSKRIRRHLATATQGRFGSVRVKDGLPPLIVHGAGCTWWSTIDKAAVNLSGLPCCPFCGGLLLETEPEDWNARVSAMEAEEPGYAALIAWLRGRCFPTFRMAKRAYAREHEAEVQVEAADG